LLLKSTLIYAPAILFTRISALLFLIVATRLIDKTEYGLLTLVVTVGEMTDVALTNWLRIALLRLGGKGEVERGSLLRAGRILLGTTCLGLAVSVAAAMIVVPERSSQFAIAVCVYLIAGAVARYALIVLQMQQRHATYSMLEFLRAVLQLLFPLATMLIDHNSFLTISLASSFGMLVAGLVASVVAFRRVVPGPARFTHREFFALGIPIVAMAVVGFGLNNAERIFLKIYHDATAVAVFAAAYALARQPIDMLANAINMGAFPEVVARFDDKGPAAASALLRNFVGLVLTLSLPTATLLVVLSDDITALLLPGSYNSSYVLLFAMIGFSAICTNLADFVYGTMIYAHKRPWLLLVSGLCGSVATIVLSVLLIPTLAGDGAALVLAGGAMTNLIAVAILSERLTPIPLPWRVMGQAAATSLGVGLAAWLVSTALADTYGIVRLAAAGMAAGVVFLATNALFYPAEARKGLGKAWALLPQKG